MVKFTSMYKISIIGILICISFNVIAQNEIHPCALAKVNAAGRMLKKTRAGNYDNQLMERYDVHWYALNLSVERNSTVISGDATVGVEVIQNTDTICLELNSNLTIDSILLNNVNTSFTHTANNIIYVIPVGTMNANTLHQVKVFYHGDAHVQGGAAIGDGFSTDSSPSWGNEATWSLSEPYSAYEWFPCKQFLSDKADSCQVYIITDMENKAGSNGLLEGVDTLPNNKLRFRWKSKYMIDYYLISVAVAKYVDYTIYAHPSQLAGDSIPIVNYVYDNPACLPFVQSRVDSVPMILEYFSDLFGLYPFYTEKYGHAMAPFSGGMEHQTMSSMGFLHNYRVNAHELMHQWWGDHVTCKSWRDIVINEGFASYGEYLTYNQFRTYQDAQDRMLSAHNDVMSDPDGSVYCYDTTNPGRIFSGRLTYNKGMSVIHTLRFIMGDSLFFKALKDFQNAYAFSTAGVDELKTICQNTSSLNLNDFFTEWFYGEGFPTYSASYYSNNGVLYLKIDESTSNAGTPLFTNPLEITCQSPSGDTTLRLDISQNTNTYVFNLGKTVNGLIIDPNNWVINGTGPVTEDPSLILLASEDILMTDDFTLYPNPVKDRLFIETAKRGVIEIRDMKGSALLQKEVLSGKNQIDISYLPSGVYFISDENGNRVKFTKH